MAETSKNCPRQSENGFLRWFLRSLLANQGLVNMWDDTTTGDSSLNQQVQFLVSADSQLQVTRCNTLLFDVLTRISRQLEHLQSGYADLRNPDQQC